MAWTVIPGTEGHYEYNSEIDTVRNARTHKTLRPKRRKNGYLVYRFKFDGRERMFSRNTVIGFKDPDNSTAFVCAVCGEKFQSRHPNAKYCSKKCRKQHDHMTYQPKLRSRCRKYGVPFTPGITKQDVIDKYHGKCCMCGKQTDSKGDIKDWPTIDHVIPLSNGGGHEWDNVQLLCYSCNSRKGTKVDEETFLAYMRGLINADR